MEALFILLSVFPVFFIINEIRKRRFIGMGFIMLLFLFCIYTLIRATVSYQKGNVCSIIFIAPLYWFVILNTITLIVFVFTNYSKRSKL